MASKANSKKKGARESNASRVAIFTFCHELNVQIGPDAVSTLCEILRKRDAKSLKDACPNGERDEGTEAEYNWLDTKILPHIALEVFFENFSRPELIFPENKNISINAASRGRDLVGAKITNFALWESNHGDDWRNLCVALEAEFRISVVDGVDIENPYDCSDDEVEEQLLECENMFNFRLSGVDYQDEDEALQNSWGARFV